MLGNFGDGGFFVIANLLRVIYALSCRVAPLVSCSINCIESNINCQVRETMLHKPCL